MRREKLLVMLTALLATAAQAEVIRCADATGKVIYTDSACPSGARKVGGVAAAPVSVVTGPSAAEVLASDPYAGSVRPRPPTYSAVLSSPGIITSGAIPPASEPVVLDDGYWYPGGGMAGANRRPPVPRIRGCNASGCYDNRGNTFNRMGQLDSYRSIDGKTCRPVGTTTICR